MLLVRLALCAGETNECYYCGGFFCAMRPVNTCVMMPCCMSYKHDGVYDGAGWYLCAATHVLLIV